jgi:hypothetical protein
LLALSAVDKVPHEGTYMRVFYVKFFVSHGGDHEDTMFLDVTPCSLVDRISYGEDACRKERVFHPEEGGGRLLLAYQSTRCHV